jgi:hypothetical protein
MSSPDSRPIFVDGRLTIHGFYTTDPRRQGPDRKFGSAWQDPRDPKCDHDVFWVPGTGELVAMRTPRPGMPVAIGVYSDTDASTSIYTPESQGAAYTVEILGHLTEDEVDALMDGWEQALAEGATLDWIRQRIAFGD